MLLKINPAKISPAQRNCDIICAILSGTCSYNRKENRTHLYFFRAFSGTRIL